MDKNLEKWCTLERAQNNKPKAPELRFSSFTDDWEQRKFKEIAIVRRGLTYSPKDVSSQGVRVLRSSNIEGEFFLLHNDDVFVNSEVVKIEYVKRGDILITAANGSPKLVGKHAIIDSTSSDLPMVHGGFMLVASSNFSDFLNASMGSFWYSSFLKRNVTGGNGAIGNLSKADLDEVTILLPSDNEKIKIGAFFKNLDNLITLHQRKLDSIKELKKDFYKKCFLKDGCKIPDKNLEKWCTLECAKNNKIYPNGTIYTALSASDGIAYQLREDGYISDRYAVFIPKTKYINVFYEIFCESFEPFYQRYNQGINFAFDNFKFFDFPEIDTKQIEEMEEALKEINNLIDNGKLFIQQMKGFKDFYLNKMFC